MTPLALFITVVRAAVTWIWFVCLFTTITCLLMH